MLVGFQAFAIAGWNNPWQQRDDDLVAFFGQRTGTKQSTEQRDIAEVRNLALAIVLLFLDQTANHDRLSIPKHHVGGDFGRFAIGQFRSWVDPSRGNSRRDLQQDASILGDDRQDGHDDTEIQKTDTLQGCCLCRSGHQVPKLATDSDLCLLAVKDGNSRRGQRFGVVSRFQAFQPTLQVRSLNLYRRDRRCFGSEAERSNIHSRIADASQLIEVHPVFVAVLEGHLQNMRFDDNLPRSNVHLRDVVSDSFNIRREILDNQLLPGGPLLIVGNLDHIGLSNRRKEPDDHLVEILSQRVIEVEDLDRLPLNVRRQFFFRVGSADRHDVVVPCPDQPIDAQDRVERVLEQHTIERDIHALVQVLRRDDVDAQLLGNQGHHFRHSSTAARQVHQIVLHLQSNLSAHLRCVGQRNRHRIGSHCIWTRAGQSRIPRLPPLRDLGRVRQGCVPWWKLL